MHTWLLQGNLNFLLTIQKFTRVILTLKLEHCPSTTLSWKLYSYIHYAPDEIIVICWILVFLPHVTVVPRFPLPLLRQKLRRTE